MLALPPEGGRFGCFEHERYTFIEQQIQKVKQGDGDKKQQEPQNSFATTFLRSLKVLMAVQAFFFFF